MTILVGDDQNNFLDLRLNVPGTTPGTTPGVAIAGFGDDTLGSVENTEPPGSLLFGNQNNDILLGRGVGDTLYGGQGADTVTGEGDNRQVLFGDLGPDTMQGERSLNTLYGGLGADSMVSGADNLFTDTGNNLLFGDLPPDLFAVLAAAGVDTTPGDDTMDGLFGEDTMVGDGGNDSMRAGPEGRSILYGNQGEDILVGPSNAGNNPNVGAANRIGGEDSLFGGVGDDSLYYDVRFGIIGNQVLGVPNNLYLSGDLGDDTVIVATGTREAIELEDDPIEVVTGQGHRLFGDRVDQQGEFGTLAGNDYLAAGGVNIFVAGNRGEDTLAYNGAGTERVSRPSLFGGQDDDILVGDETGLGTQGDGIENGIFSGDLGNDYIEFRGSGHTNNLLRGDAPGGLGSGNDTLFLMSDGNNTLEGGDGDDYLFSMHNGTTPGEGNFLSYGPGDNVVIFSATDTLEANTLDAGANLFIGKGVNQSPISLDEDDTFQGDGLVEGSEGPDTVNLNDGGATLKGGDDLATFTGNITDPTYGNEGNDTIQADGNAEDTVSGGAGDDSIDIAGDTGTDAPITGEDGNDTLNVGGEAMDSVLGGAGDDQIDVGTASDVVSGGADNDTIGVDSLNMGTVSGDDGNDSIDVMDGGNGLIDGGNGDDNINLDTANGDSIVGGAGNDYLTSEMGDVGEIDGGIGDDTIGIGGAGSVSGGDGNDILTKRGAGTGAANFDGGAGNDFLGGGIDGGTSADTLDGGDGDDVIFGGASGETIPASGSEIAEDIESVFDGDKLTGGPGADNFIFTSENQTGAIANQLGTVGGGTATGQFADLFMDQLTFGTDGAITDAGSVAELFEQSAADIISDGTTTGTSFDFDATKHVDTITDFNPAEDQLVLQSGNFGADAFTTGDLDDLISGSAQSAAFSFESGTTDFPGLNAVKGSGEFGNGSVVNGVAGEFFFDTEEDALYYGLGGSEMALLVDFENNVNLTAADITFEVEGGSGFQLF